MLQATGYPAEIADFYSAIWPDGKAGLDSGLDWTGFFRRVILF